MDKPKALLGTDPAILACYPPDTVDPWRGTGRTTRQIQALPPRSLFVTAGSIDHTVALVRSLGRHVGPEDITLTAHWDFHNYAWKNLGREWSAIELDHAVFDVASKRQAREIRITYDRIAPYIRLPREV